MIKYEPITTQEELSAALDAGHIVEFNSIDNMHPEYNGPCEPDEWDTPGQSEDSTCPSGWLVKSNPFAILRPRAVYRRVIRT